MVSGMKDPRTTGYEMRRRGALPAWALSLLMHTALLMAVAYLLRFAPRGTASDPSDRTVGVALVKEASGEREYQTAEERAAEAQAASLPEELADVLPTPADAAVDLAAVLPSSDTGGGALDAMSLPQAAGARTGAGGLAGLSDQVRTTVFGTSGTGNTFVYVFDRSGSMAGFMGRPLAAAKRELMASVQDLQSTNRFQIIFYNEEPHVFQFRPGTPGLEWGTEEVKASATRFVQSVAASGSTRHVQALRMALGLHPDVLFFLTDADEPQLTTEDLRQIRRWNQATAINAIEFGFGPASGRDNFLKRLARENGGQHVYVDVSSLRLNP